MGNASAMIGREIGQRYVIRSVLGRGGNAVVFKATDAARGGDVALKIYGADHFDAQTAEAASHFRVSDSSAVLPLWDVHTDFLEGPATAMPIMNSTLAEQGTVLVSTAVHVTRRILTALEFCHGRNVVHGDVKPANVFFDDDDNVRLGDFGAADRTAEYSSPELTAGQPKDEGADLWATAVTFYEMLVDKLPFGCQPDLTETEIGELVLSGTWEPPDATRPYLPMKYRRFFERAFAADPAARFANAAAMRRALKDLAVHVEWARLHAPPAIVYEGSEIRADGSLTGVRYKATLAEGKAGLWTARIDKATKTGTYRKLTRLAPHVGSKAQAGQKLQVWMRKLTEHGAIT